MKQILLDTNFLLIPAQFKVDIFSEIDRISYFKYELIVIDKTLEELEQISKGKGKDGRAAKVAIKLITNKKIKVISTSDTSAGTDYADRMIIEIAGNNKEIIVATQDRQLKKILHENKTKLIVMKNKGHLDFA